MERGSRSILREKEEDLAVQVLGIFAALLTIHRVKIQGKYITS
jgi:hypothetical protein